MGYLINNEYLFIFNAIKKGGEDTISLCAINSENKEKHHVLDRVRPGFKDCHMAIKNFLDSNGCSRFCPDLFEMIVRQIRCYTSNLYGFHLIEEGYGKDEWMTFFKEAYISCFALEMSSFFFSLADGQKSSLEERLRCRPDAGDEFYSEVLALDGFYRQWKLIEGL